MSRINKFLHKKYSPNNEVPLNDNKNFYFSLQYFGNQSEKFKTELNTLLNKYFKDLNFNIILVNKFTIGSLFKCKDTLHKGMQANVVYKYCCPNYGISYIGSTIRNLSTRAAEHAGVSVRTQRSLSQPPHSHIREHHVTCKSPAINIEHFAILGKNSNKIDIRILESLYINKQKPVLNSSQSAYPLYIVNK